MIIAYVTADRNWGIGKNGNMLTNIPEDTKYLRSTCAGNNVIMGRKTFESLRPVQITDDRNYIVLSRKKDYAHKGATVVHSAKEAIEAAEKNGGDTYVLGGGECFASMLKYCEEVQLTFVDYSYDADSFFPDLDKMPEWVPVQKSDEQTHFDTIYFFIKYKRRLGFKS